MRKRQRLKRIGTQDAPQVFRMGVFASISYECVVHGVTDARLREVRAYAASMYGETRGRSASARLIVTGSDPSEKYVVGPIKLWVQAIWDGVMEKRDAEDAWKYAIKDVAMARRPHERIIGGAGALHGAILRLGWSMPSYTSFRTNDGTLLTIEEGSAGREGVHYVDPFTIEKWAEDDLINALARNSQVAYDINDLAGARGYGRECPVGMRQEENQQFYGESHRQREMALMWRRGVYQTVEDMVTPWLLPARRFFKQATRRGVGHKIMASFRSMIEGGWFTQTRLAAAGIAADGRCSCEQGLGTLWHKLSACPHTEALREQHCPASIRKKAMVRLWDPLFTRGVPAAPKIPKTPKGGIYWTGKEPSAVEGVIYSDGACSGHWGRVKRAGTALVQVDGEGKLIWALHVVSGDLMPSSFRAELRALKEIMQRTTGDVLMLTDNALVVKGFEEGPEWSTEAKREGADLWRSIWARKLMLDGEGIEVKVRKVKGHASKEDVQEGRVRAIDAVGNHEADRAAVQAARRAELESPTKQQNAMYEMAMDWYRWTLHVAANWTKDTTVEVSEATYDGLAEEEQEGYVVDRNEDVLTHDLWETARQVADGRKGRKTQKELLCRVCGTKWQQDDKEEAERGRCGGSAAGRAEAHMTKDQTAIWRRFMLATSSLRMMGARRVRPHTIPVGMMEDEGEEEGDGGGEEGEKESGPRVEHVPAYEAMGHRLVRTGPILWCVKCVAFSHIRHGVSFKEACKGYSNLGARRARRERLAHGLHPLSGERVA